MLTGQLARLKSFTARKRYMNSLYTTLGTGTGRTEYDIGSGKALKLAINARWKAQNLTEAVISSYYSTILPTVYSQDEGGEWIICDKAISVRKADFKKYLGVDMDTVFSYMDPTARVTACIPSAVQSAISCIADFDLVPADITRKGSWGLIGDRMVIRDCGLTEEVWREFYKETYVNGRWVKGERKV